MNWYDELLKHDFTSFIGKTLSTCDPGAHYLPNWHIELIAEYLEAARKGQIKRLIINMPPRSLKSVCASVAWPAWLLGHNPSSRIIAASYAQSLAVKHSIDTRNVMKAPWYQRLFPEVQLSREQNEKSKFMTTSLGFRMAASVGGAITGEGGNYLIIDDPINPLQARNKHWRNHVNQWFDHTFASRLNDKRNGVIVLVMQRLHCDDLSGFLSKRNGWENLVLPMVATESKIYDFGSVYKIVQPGELLHEKRDTQEIAQQAKLEMGTHVFAAQYQQKPLPDDGAMVRPWWFGRYAQAPDDAERIVQSWDTAIKAGSGNDASVCLTFAEKEGKSYLLDAAVMRCVYPDLKKALYSLYERWQPHAVLIEDKASGQQLLQDVKRESMLPAIAVHPKRDKVTRFAAVSAMIEAKRVILPNKSPWLADFEEELWMFPHGRNDDQVDALSQYLDWLRERIVSKPAVRQL